MADIDHFKKVNDSHGHPVGDLVIQSVARDLMKGLRTEDAVGRVGGEEFLIVLVGSNTKSIRQTLDRIRASIASTPVEIENGKVFVTMSFGAVAATADKSIELDTLVKRADEALYKAKKLGRNRVEIASAAPASASSAKTG
jgi:diguanylate cyclase (GGDEF)-like protein